MTSREVCFVATFLATEFDCILEARSSLSGKPYLVSCVRQFAWRCPGEEICRPPLLRENLLMSKILINA